MKRRAGFTLAELIVALTISSIVLIGAYKVLAAQYRTYGQQVAVEDVGETLRGAAALLGWEIHHAEMASDDIFSTSPDTLSVRSIQGVGIVCVINTANAAAGSVKYGIWKNGGDIEATADDSGLVYSQDLQLWRKMKINAVGTPAAMSVPSCSWSGGRAPDIVVQMTVNSTSDTTGIQVGSIFRSFRRTTFALYQSSGKWWLGRHVGSNAWETITGPMLGNTAPKGLQFAYHDSLGTNSTDTISGTANFIREIAITLRAQSYRPYRKSDGTADYRIDSVSTLVYIRR